MATSSGSAGTSVVIANLTDQGSGQFFATSSNTQVRAQFHPECLEDLPQESSGICCRYAIQGTVGANGAVTIAIAVLGADANNTQQGAITVTGTLSSDGKSMTGTYSSTYTNGTAPDSGNFTASLVEASDRKVFRLSHLGRERPRISGYGVLDGSIGRNYHRIGKRQQFVLSERDDVRSAE